MSAARLLSLSRHPAGSEIGISPGELKTATQADANMRRHGRYVGLLGLTFQLADMVTTLTGMQLGGVEMNPVYHHIGALAFWTVKIAVGLLWLLLSWMLFDWLPLEAQIVAKVLASIVLFSFAFPAAWNSILILLLIYT